MEGRWIRHRTAALVGQRVCSFCKIVSREEKSYIVFEDDVSLTFLDKRPVFIGHCLLVPRLHHETLGDLPRDAVPRIFENVQLLSIAVVQAMGADGSLIAINNRVSQSVPHLHIHVIPRKRGEVLRGFLWPRRSYRNEESAQNTASAIRSAIAELRSR